MEYGKCAVEECYAEPAFLIGPQFESLVCWEHLQEYKKGIENVHEERQWMNHYCRPIISQSDQPPQFFLGYGFGTSCLFWVANETAQMPQDMNAALEELANAFVLSIFEAGNGKLKTVKKLCNKFAVALNQIIFNLQFNVQEMYDGIERVYNNFHSEKQTIISKLVAAELEAIESRLQMPKKATKNFISQVDLEAVKQNFILKYFVMDTIDFKEFFQTFCSNFSPFLKNAPNHQIFDGLENSLQEELGKLQFSTKADFLMVIKKVWQDCSYQTSTVYMREVPNNEEPLNICHKKTRICCFFLSQTDFVLESVHALSKTDLLLVLSANSNTYLVLFSNRKACLIKEYLKTTVQVAEGSNENFILVLHQGKCEIFALNEFHLQPTNNELDLKLDLGETVEDFLFIQSVRPKVVFSTNRRGICSIVKNGPRAFINLTEEVAETSWKLTHFKAKELILLKSNKQVRVFSEFLVKLAEIPAEYERITFRPCKERVLKVLGLKNSQVHEVVIDIRLDYSELGQARAVDLPGPTTHYVSKYFTEAALEQIAHQFRQFVSRSFLISS